MSALKQPGGNYKAIKWKLNRTPSIRRNYRCVFTSKTFTSYSYEYKATKRHKTTKTMKQELYGLKIKVLPSRRKAQTRFVLAAEKTNINLQF